MKPGIYVKVFCVLAVKRETCQSLSELLPSLKLYQLFASEMLILLT